MVDGLSRVRCVASHSSLIVLNVTADLRGSAYVWVTTSAVTWLTRAWASALRSNDWVRSWPSLPTHLANHRRPLLWRRVQTTAPGVPCLASIHHVPASSLGLSAG